MLKYHLTPSTADDKDKQFVYLDLTITLSVMVNTCGRSSHVTVVGVVKWSHDWREYSNTIM